jgi:DNA-binding MarR family transcriptional regulator
MMEIEELTRWILSVDRRVIVMKELQKNELIKASEIAEKAGRSLQNISRAIRELEEHGLIECLTPEKHTWKRYILTKKGAKVYEKIKKNHLN